MTEAATTGYRICPKCNEKKHVLAFAAHNSKDSRADKTASHCRDCEGKTRAARKRASDRPFVGKSRFNFSGAFEKYRKS
jgi:hypothetical protein